MQQLLSIAKALSDETRLRAFAALAGGELCVCQIVALLEMAPSTVSKHMSILHRARLVDSRRDGRWMIYRLAGDGAPEEVLRALTWVRETLDGDSAVERDRCRTAEVLNCTREELCR